MAAVAVVGSPVIPAPASPPQLAHGIAAGLTRLSHFDSIWTKADPSKVAPTAAAFADDHCEHCHREHASTDNVWVQFYPTLRK
jgi:hypothetical protein